MKKFSLMASDNAFVEIKELVGISINGVKPVYTEIFNEGIKEVDNLLIGQEAFEREINSLCNGGFEIL